MRRKRSAPQSALSTSGLVSLCVLAWCGIATRANAQLVSTIAGGIVAVKGDCQCTAPGIALRLAAPIGESVIGTEGSVLFARHRDPNTTDPASDRIFADLAVVIQGASSLVRPYAGLGLGGVYIRGGPVASRGIHSAISLPFGFALGLRSNVALRVEARYRLWTEAAGATVGGSEVTAGLAFSRGGGS